MNKHQDPMDAYSYFVLWFAERMREELLRNDHKTGWGHLDFQTLIDYIERNTMALDVDVSTTVTSMETIIRRCADIANLAAMIADKAREHDTPFGRASGRAVCKICDREFQYHAPDRGWQDKDGNCYLTRLCDGSLVKL